VPLLWLRIPSHKRTSQPLKPTWLLE
jgi:hypothetical protein